MDVRTLRGASLAFALLAASAGTALAAGDPVKGKAEFVNYSFDVMFEGKNVARAMDLMLHNNKNTPPFPVIQGPVIAMGGEKGNCYVCEDPL